MVNVNSDKIQRPDTRRLAWKQWKVKIRIQRRASKVNQNHFLPNVNFSHLFTLEIWDLFRMTVKVKNSQRSIIRIFAWQKSIFSKSAFFAAPVIVIVLFLIKWKAIQMFQSMTPNNSENWSKDVNSEETGRNVVPYFLTFCRKSTFSIQITSILRSCERSVIILNLRFFGINLIMK